MNYYRNVDKMKLNIIELTTSYKDYKKYFKEYLGIKYSYKKGKYNITAFIFYTNKVNKNEKSIYIKMNISNEKYETIYNGQVETTNFDIETMKKEIKGYLTESYKAEVIIYPNRKIKSKDKKLYDEYINNAVEVKKMLQLYFGI